MGKFDLVRNGDTRTFDHQAFEYRVNTQLDEGHAIGLTFTHEHFAKALKVRLTIEMKWLCHGSLLFSTIASI
ncbi:hypothetical protein BRCON_1485 [Candidatus Sumerlaea chitinivorans]|uniref:Uncharacterized protein n=1 Tax=Sumerlaea chitinivorans TaxID=2250252 RepID=A0A2Z4Y6C3_SUMC1|nr:hypothetical protein BRCON_1485 [Candidatus Sumerlaea chitinivorans]